MTQQQIRSWEDIPEECWELILTRLNQPHHSTLEPLSLVCKRFLSISNRLRSTFNLTDPTRSISPLLHRFHHLKQINFSNFHGDLDQIILEIAHSHLPNLESLDISKQQKIPLNIAELGRRNPKVKLRTLICSELCFLRDSDLKLIADSFPDLEKLDVSYPEKDFVVSFPPNLDSSFVPGIVTDEGVIYLVTNLPKLRKINLSGNHFVTDYSLVSMSANCQLLNEIAVCDCSFLTQNGISLVMRNCTSLVSLSINGNKILSSALALPLPSNSFTMETSFVYSKALQVLDLSQMFISDEFLISIVLANLPLEKLSLSRCIGFSFRGISRLLSMYSCLKFLDLNGAEFLTDDHVKYVSGCLHELTYICLKSCSNLTSSTFVTLLENCPSLEEIRMENTSLGKGNLPTSLVRSVKVQCLKLAMNRDLTDEMLVKLVSYCPEVRLLDVGGCWSITEQGMQGIGTSCKEIVELDMSYCAKVRNLGKDVEYSKLEVLRASGSGIDNKGLSMIGESCRQLVCLHLMQCSGISDEGVKEVVKKCKRLKEVSLKYCDGKTIQILAWMIFTRPSLRKIVPPFGICPSEMQRNLFIHHGCLICDD